MPLQKHSHLHRTIARRRLGREPPQARLGRAEYKPWPKRAGLLILPRYVMVSDNLKLRLWPRREETPSRPKSRNVFRRNPPCAAGGFFPETPVSPPLLSPSASHELSPDSAVITDCFGVELLFQYSRRPNLSRQMLSPSPWGDEP